MQIDQSRSFLFLFSSSLSAASHSAPLKRNFDEKSSLHRIPLGLTEHVSSNFPTASSVRDRCSEEKRVYIASKTSSSKLSLSFSFGMNAQHHLIDYSMLFFLPTRFCRVRLTFSSLFFFLPKIQMSYGLRSECSCQLRIKRR